MKIYLLVKDTFDNRPIGGGELEVLSNIYEMTVEELMAAAKSHENIVSNVDGCSIFFERSSYQIVKTYYIYTINRWRKLKGLGPIDNNKGNNRVGNTLII